MKKSDLPLPLAGSSMAAAVLRLEQISQAIYASMRQKRRAKSTGGADDAFHAYDHFRQRAYKLLTHYVASDLQASFGWLLAMRNSAPKRSRGRVAGNPFHIGLLAMTAAAGPFMSRNKLRDLANFMSDAHAAGVHDSEFNDFVSNARKTARRHVAKKPGGPKSAWPDAFDLMWD